MGYDRQTQTAFPICTAGGYQMNPHISGNLVVWDDFRGDGWSSMQTNPVIYAGVIDPDTHAVTELAIAGGKTAGGEPCCDLSGNVVVWTTNYDVQATVIDTATLSASTFLVLSDLGGRVAADARVDGNRVVWALNDGTNASSDVYAATIDPVAKTATAPVAICAENAFQGAPDVSGNWVVWEDLQVARQPMGAGAARQEPEDQGHVRPGRRQRDQQLRESRAVYQRQLHRVRARRSTGPTR